MYNNLLNLNTYLIVNKKTIINVFVPVVIKDITYFSFQT